MLVALWPLSAQYMRKFFSASLAAKKCETKDDIYLFSRHVWRKIRHQAANPAQAFHIIGYRIWSFSEWYR
jgi:hypothetical protein